MLSTWNEISSRNNSMKTSNQITLIGSGQMVFLTFPPNPPRYLHSLPLFLPPPLLGSLKAPLSAMCSKCWATTLLSCPSQGACDPGFRSEWPGMPAGPSMWGSRSSRQVPTAPGWCQLFQRNEFHLVLPPQTPRRSLPPPDPLGCSGPCAICF